MSGDLSPTALAEREIGSAQDHNARHERHTAMLDAAHAPLLSWPAVLFWAVLIGAGAAAFVVGRYIGELTWTWYVAGPPPFFNFFNR